MAVGDYFKLSTVAQHVVGGQTAVNSFYFQQLNALVFDTPEEDLFDAFLTHVEPTYINLFNNALSVIRVNIGQGPLFATSFSQTVIWTGTQTGDYMPPQCAGVLQYKTAVLSRRGRGRIFCFPSSEASNGTGAPTGSYLTGILALGEALKDDMGAGDTFHAQWGWGMWSEADQAFRLITSYSAGTYWGSQRDRRGIY